MTDGAAFSGKFNVYSRDKCSGNSDLQFPTMSVNCHGNQSSPAICIRNRSNKAIFVMPFVLEAAGQDSTDCAKDINTTPTANAYLFLIQLDNLCWESTQSVTISSNDDDISLDEYSTLRCQSLSHIDSAGITNDSENDFLDGNGYLDVNFMSFQITSSSINSGSYGIELNVEIIGEHKVIANHDVSNYDSNYKYFGLAYVIDSNPFKNRSLSETNPCKNRSSSGFETLCKYVNIGCRLLPSNNTLLDDDIFVWIIQIYRIMFAYLDILLTHEVSMIISKSVSILSDLRRVIWYFCG